MSFFVATYLNCKNEVTQQNYYSQGKGQIFFQEMPSFLVLLSAPNFLSNMKDNHATICYKKWDYESSMVIKYNIEKAF